MRGPQIEIADGLFVSRRDDDDGCGASVAVRNGDAGDPVLVWRDDLIKMLDLLDGKPVQDVHGVVHAPPDGGAP